MSSKLVYSSSDTIPSLKPRYFRLSVRLTLSLLKYLTFPTINSGGIKPLNNTSALQVLSL